ncbi:MAG: HugZ family pyridoxamine 5'-phosphate oxidase [Pseudoalteromonas sp.]
MREQALNDARTLVYKTNAGVMSTISNNLRGYPFGSVTPYMCDEQGRVYFFISDIAQHTKNLKHDSRMSLTVYDAADYGDQNEHGRVTLVGDGSIVPSEQAHTLLNNYIALYPEAASYRNAHDFQLWQLDVVRVRYIGGFGKIFWLLPTGFYIQSQKRNYFINFKTQCNSPLEVRKALVELTNQARNN